MSKYRFVIVDEATGTEWSYALHSLPAADDLNDLVDDLHGAAEEFGALFDVTLQPDETGLYPFGYRVPDLAAEHYPALLRYWEEYLLDYGYHLGALESAKLVT